MNKIIFGEVVMELVRVTRENIETEHICCAIANNKDIQVMSKKCWLKERIEQAQNVPTPFTTFSLFYQGEFVTHEILSEKKFEKILISKGL